MENKILINFAHRKTYMVMIKNLTVYAASSTQVKSEYFAAARRMGELLAENEVRLIYGAGKVGLMGAIADGALSTGGKVTGVIPQFMVDFGWCHDGLNDLIVTSSMHERKATICQMADAMLALPGGIGTFEELLECLTWKQLGLHTKPIVILNTDGYYDNLLRCLDQMVGEQFMRLLHKQMYVVVSEPEQVLQAIADCPTWDTSIRKQAQL